VNLLSLKGGLVIPAIKEQIHSEPIVTKKAPISLRELARRVADLPLHPPVTTAFERTLKKRGIWGGNRAWYRSQREHWLGWLNEYNGPGYYGRKNHRRSAKFIYNHIVCPPMVLWLGEAVGIPTKRVAEAKQAALSAGPHLSAQSAAIRKVIPWEDIAALLI
jgi:hypothetical protein